MEQNTNWLPDFLQGKNGKVVLWVLGGIVIILLLVWVVVSFGRSTKEGQNPLVVEPSYPNSNSNPNPNPVPNASGGSTSSQWNNPQKIQEDAKTIAWYIFNHLKEGWSTSWVCLSNFKISTAVAAMVGSSDAFLSLVCNQYRQLDPQMSPKMSELLEKTSCSTGSNKKLLIGRLKNLGL